MGYSFPPKLCALFLATAASETCFWLHFKIPLGFGVFFFPWLWNKTAAQRAEIYGRHWPKLLWMSECWEIKEAPGNNKMCRAPHWRHAEGNRGFCRGPERTVSGQIQTIYTKEELQNWNLPQRRKTLSCRERGKIKKEGKKGKLTFPENRYYQGHLYLLDETRVGFYCPHFTDKGQVPCFKITQIENGATEF